MVRTSLLGSHIFDHILAHKLSDNVWNFSSIKDSHLDNISIKRSFHFSETFDNFANKKDKNSVTSLHHSYQFQN